jgi:signal transduction histidine kinase
MRERAELIGAQLTLDSALGDGSTVTLRVPTASGLA